MNRSDFVHIINQEGPIAEANIPHLQDLVEEFPYFEAGQILLSKAYHNHDHMQFESQLRKTAAYASDRKKLHQLIFSSEPSHDISSPEIEVQSSPEAEEEHLTVQELESDDATDIVPNNEEDPLHNQILTAAINSSILQEVSEEINPEDLDSLMPAIVKKETQSKPVFDEEKEHSFSDWMKHFGEGKEPKTSFDFDIDESHSLEKQDFYSPAKMAKLSVQEDDDLVTETLANIYADQGNFDKALKAFQKLQLKYPEKKIYFAGRIKEIENQLKDQ